MQRRNFKFLILALVMSQTKNYSCKFFLLLQIYILLYMHTFRNSEYFEPQLEIVLLMENVRHR